MGDAAIHFRFLATAAPMRQHAAHVGGGWCNDHVPLWLGFSTPARRAHLLAFDLTYHSMPAVTDLLQC
jgi:hypothetical protein